MLDHVLLLNLLSQMRVSRPTAQPRKEIMNENKLERQDGSQKQPRNDTMKGDNLEDKEAATKSSSEGEKLGDKAAAAAQKQPRRIFSPTGARDR